MSGVTPPDGLGAVRFRRRCETPEQEGNVQKSKQRDQLGPRPSLADETGSDLRLEARAWELLATNRPRHACATEISRGRDPSQETVLLSNNAVWPVHCGAPIVNAAYILDLL